MLADKTEPPIYCEYCTGPCDQKFNGTPRPEALFLYPSDPQIIAETVRSACRTIRKKHNGNWLTWEDLDVSGQIIFCSICKVIRFTPTIVIDVSTLNFNLLFEIGYAIGLGQPVIPIRDTTYDIDKVAFGELGILDTVGYLDFQNSDELVVKLENALPGRPVVTPNSDLNSEAPLYLVKGPFQTDAEIHIQATIKKSWLKYRTYDFLETPRISLHELYKQVRSSFGVVVHLLAPSRSGALAHNARGALIAGLSMAQGKITLMLQEDRAHQPIDYRDVIFSYTLTSHIAPRLDQLIGSVMEAIQTRRMTQIELPTGLLQQLDIGDVAAENEIRPLREYFVETGQYVEAKRGHARLVVGRRGSGKTAIFYAIRSSFGRSHSRVVLDLKPEGHQFSRLRETVLEKLSAGAQESLLTAFWTWILLCEMAEKILENERTWAERDPRRWEKFEKLLELRPRPPFEEKPDFSERLLEAVTHIREKFEEIDESPTPNNLINALFGSTISSLNSALSDYMSEKDEVCLLIDNLDKGWPTHGATSEDILILRTLLEATRKIQRQLERRDVNFECLVFLRNDIHDHLYRSTPDKGKDTAIILDWSDEELFKQIFLRRIASSTDLEGDFETVWSVIFPAHVRSTDSFHYMMDRTLKRPRDFLTFIHRAVEVAINRGHDSISESDLEQAEKYYSEDLLKTVEFELRGVLPEAPDLLANFLDCPAEMAEDELLEILKGAGVEREDLRRVVELLAWFGFIGVIRGENSLASYSHDIRYNMSKLFAPVNQDVGYFCIHPAFRAALECR